MKLSIAGVFCWLAAIVRGDSEVCSNNGCVSFSVGPGTGCAWMCNYCANIVQIIELTKHICIYNLVPIVFLL